MCVVGKPRFLEEFDWPNPIIFGASIFAHPIEAPNFWERHPNVMKMLVPGGWMKDMFAQHYPEEKIEVWPVGIDTEHWRPKCSSEDKSDRVLLYDKILWERDHYQDKLIARIREFLSYREIEIETLRYGSYFPEDLETALKRCRAVVFISRHETQGIAYQQMLASGVPLFAWDRGGFWQDPEYFPDQVRYEPVSSVPYWDDRCGMTFASADEFEAKFDIFWERLHTGNFQPREYILENLTLEHCARRYAEIAEKAAAGEAQITR
jgi:glycosyltransferase involved in cell wall biosynthesis